LDAGKYIVDATQDVFASMIFMEIVPEPLSEEPVASLEPSLSSLIGLAGDFKGILAIHCPEKVALGIAGSMLGMELTELNEDVKDAIGEIANMVAGGLKESLASEGKKIELAIPTTVIGKSIRTSGLSGATRVLIPFATLPGRFGIELRYVLT
jgi:chemotaxis protein CheX